MIDSVWEDMNDDGRVMFSWLPDSLLTQCGKTGVATAKSKPFVTRLDSAPLRGQSATGLVRILITQKGDKRRQFVQETELYRFCASCFDS